ncbi:MAG: DHHW family protein [Ruthenibacterium sp.]
MQKWKRRLQKYPLVFLFFFLLFGFAVLDSQWPKRPYSELENRPLAQYPPITAKGLATNKWMVNYESYVKDQFAFRDTWIDLKSRTEGVLLKTENNGIWFGKDHYLFAKFLGLADETQYKDNVYALSKFAARHPGQVDAIIVPSASAVLQDKLPFAAPVLNEDSYLDTIFAQLKDAGVNTCDVRSTLREHANDYIYYRTDHHWTSAGAYLAYAQYAKAKGLPLFDTAAAPAVEVPDFYGTHYSKARNYNVVTDTITYYDLPNTLTVSKHDPQNNVQIEEGSLYDTAKFDTRDKYAAFLRGNNGYSVLQGNGTGSILVVKDSYANSFIPYLVADYATIGIVDYRDNVQKLDSIMAEGNYDTVLFLYSFDAFTTDRNFAAKIIKP